MDRQKFIEEYFNQKVKIISDSAVFKCMVYLPTTFDHYYYFCFDGNNLKYIHKISSRTKLGINGQIISGNLKPNKKDLQIFSEIIQKWNQLKESVTHEKPII